MCTDVGLTRLGLRWVWGRGALDPPGPAGSATGAEIEVRLVAAMG